MSRAPKMVPKGACRRRASRAPATPDLSRAGGNCDGRRDRALGVFRGHGAEEGAELVPLDHFLVEQPQRQLVEVGPALAEDAAGLGGCVPEGVFFFCVRLSGGVLGMFSALVS